jgi:hypothetical protein
MALRPSLVAQGHGACIVLDWIYGDGNNVGSRQEG